MVASAWEPRFKWILYCTFPKKVNQQNLEFLNPAKNIPVGLPSSPIKILGKPFKTFLSYNWTDRQTNRDYILYIYRRKYWFVKLYLPICLSLRIYCKNNKNSQNIQFLKFWISLGASANILFKNVNTNFWHVIQAQFSKQ